MDRLLMAIKRYKLAAGALIAACSGALIAVGSQPALQAPVETGQVLAGIVRYPADNPFYVYHVKLWTLLNQIAAGLLASGVSELDASLIIEGLTGALSFVAIFLIVHAISSRTMVALFTPLFMYYFSFVGIDIAYPIWLMGTSNTYGIFGLSYTVLVIGLFGTGRRRSGAFFAGLAPAFHPSLGAFCVVVAAAAVLVNRKALQQELPGIVRWFTAGAVVTGASLLWQLHLSAHITGTDLAQRTAYLDAFIRNFDYHRSFSGWLHIGLLTGVATAALALLARFKRDAPLGAKLVLDAIAASVAVTIASAFLIDFVPFLDPLKVLMPWRYMNFVNLCAVPVVFGVLTGDIGAAPRARSIVFLSLLTLCVLWRALAVPGDAYLYLGMILLAAVPFARSFRDAPEELFPQLPLWQRSVTASACVLLVITLVAPAAKSLILRDEGRVRDIFKVASTRQGMLLTAGDMHLIQLQTRRPVLIDGGGLDMFPMVPETGPRFNDILRKVYGLDVFVPPPDEERNKGVIPRSHQQLWEERSTDAWRMIGSEFGVTDILTPSGWELRLPVAADDGNLRLYTIP